MNDISRKLSLSLFPLSNDQKVVKEKKKTLRGAGGEEREKEQVERSGGRKSS